MKNVVAGVVLLASVGAALFGVATLFGEILTTDPYRYQPWLKIGFPYLIVAVALSVLFWFLGRGVWRAAVV